MHSKVCHAPSAPPMLQVRNSSQKSTEVQHCSSVMSGICSTKPLADAALDGAGSGLPPPAPPPCSLGVGLSASSGCASSVLLLLVACSDMQCSHLHCSDCLQCQHCSVCLQCKHYIVNTACITVVFTLSAYGMHSTSAQNALLSPWRQCNDQRQMMFSDHAHVLCPDAHALTAAH